MAVKHRELMREIDMELRNRGYDIDEIAEEDACGYVDVIDKGLGYIDYDELEEYKEENNG